MLNKQSMGRFKMTDMGDVSNVSGTKVNRRGRGRSPLIKGLYDEGSSRSLGLEELQPLYTAGVGFEQFLNQPEEKWLNEDKKFHQCIASKSLGMFFATVSSWSLISW